MLHDYGIHWYINAAIRSVNAAKWSRSKLLIFICPLLDYDKKGKKMLTGRSMISTSGEALIKGFMMKFVQEHCKFGIFAALAAISLYPLAYLSKPQNKKLITFWILLSLQKNCDYPQFGIVAFAAMKDCTKVMIKVSSLLIKLNSRSEVSPRKDANQKVLRVFDSECTQSLLSSLVQLNVTLVSSESTSSTERCYGPQLDHEDLEQLDEFDFEEMDLKWQLAMISMRLKKFYKKTGRRLQFDAKEPVGFNKTKVEYFNCHKIGNFARESRSKGNQESKRRDAGNTRYRAKDNRRRPRKQEEPKALVTLDGEGVDWTGHVDDEQENFNILEQLSDASIEIQAYTQALKKVEAQLVAHQKNQLWYEEKIRFMKIDLDDKTDVLTYHKKLLAEAVKEKEELKTKLENFQSSSKGLSKLLNSQISAKDKSGLGYGNQVHEGVLSYENEVFQSVFDSRSSDVEDSHVHDRFANVEGMHAVPPPMTRNYMPPGPDREVDDSMFTYGPK
ncbi:hypothetical protein Tco_0196357 [Tanacetum coccineum]